MVAAKIPDNELERLKALIKLNILDTDSDDIYDTITNLAATIMDAPIALISLVDSDRQWFKSKVGMVINETPREYSFCAHAILTPEMPMIINDSTKDKRFSDNPFVDGREGKVRFYFGTPLVTSGQQAIGTLCVVDEKVRKSPTEKQIKALRDLSKLVMSQLELREFIIDIHGKIENLEKNEISQVSIQMANAYKDLNSQCDYILDRIKARKNKEQQNK